MCFYFFIFQPFEEHEIGKIGDVVAGSVICSNGNLTPNFEYIAKLRAENEASAAPKGDFSTEKKVSTLAIIRTYISTLSTYTTVHHYRFWFWVQDMFQPQLSNTSQEIQALELLWQQI